MAVLLDFCLQLWFSATTRNWILFRLISCGCIYSSLSSKSCASHAYGATSFQSDHHVVRCHKLSVWPPCGTVPQAFSLTTMWYGATSFQSDHHVVQCHKLSVWPPCGTVPQAFSLTTMWYGARSFQSDHLVVHCWLVKYIMIWVRFHAQNNVLSFEVGNEISSTISYFWKLHSEAFI